YYHLINFMGLIRNEGGFVSETAIGALYRLYRPAFPGEVLSLEVVCAELAPGIRIIDALAMRSEDKVWLFLSNRSISERIEITLQEMPMPEQLFSVNMMTAAHDRAPMVDAEAPVVEGAVIVPPLSIVRICYSVH